jgi:hypothetical protein
MWQSPHPELPRSHFRLISREALTLMLQNSRLTGLSPTNPDFILGKISTSGILVMETYLKDYSTLTVWRSQAANIKLGALFSPQCTTARRAWEQKTGRTGIHHAFSVFFLFSLLSLQSCKKPCNF